MPFTINVSGLNNDAVIGYGGPFGTVIENELSNGLVKKYQQFQSPFNTENVFIPAPPPVDSIVSVIVPRSNEEYNALAVEIAAVNFNSLQYVPFSGNGVIPEECTYLFDPATQTLTLKLPDGFIFVVGQSIKITVIRDKKRILSDRYRGQIPQFFRDWNINGAASFSRSLEASPSGSISFRMFKRDFESRLCELKEGTLIEWRGHGYATKSVTSKWLPSQDQVEVTLSLHGPHDHLMNEQVRYRGSLGKGAFSGQKSSNGSFAIAAIQKAGLIVDGVSASRNSSDSAEKVTINFATLCRRAGLAYAGPAVSFRIAKERDKRDSTTIQSELGRSRAVESFSYLSNSNAIEFRKWFVERTSHLLSRLDILNNDDNKIDISYNISGNEWNGIKLASEYKNTQLNLDESEINERDASGGTNYKITLRYGSAVKLTASGKIVITTPPSNVDRSNPSANFDEGGPTKEYIVERYQNGVLISKTKTVYGYAYKVSDFVTFSSANENVITSNIPSPEQQPRLIGWGIVKKESEEYEFDGDGYLIKITNFISTKRRFKQETDANETLQIHAEANFATSNNSQLQIDLRNAKNQVLGLYDYFDVTETDVTKYTLERLEDYYPDLPPLDDGDPDRKFVSRIERSHKSHYESSDLSYIRVDDNGNALKGSRAFQTVGTDFSAAVEGLTVSTGVDREEMTIVHIAYPPKGVSKANYRKELDQYREMQEARTASGENLKNVLQLPSESREMQGRPQEAKRLELFEDGDTPTPEDEEAENKILLNTPNNGLNPQTDAIDGSVSFPSATTKSKGVAAAIADASIQNTQAVEIWSNLWVPTDRIYDEGDILVFQGKKYRILNIEEPINIETKNSIGFAYQVLSIGREIDLRGHVTVSEVD